LETNLVQYGELAEQIDRRHIIGHSGIFFSIETSKMDIALVALNSRIPFMIFSLPVNTFVFAACIYPLSGVHIILLICANA
jgi:hypothetical protein